MERHKNRPHMLLEGAGVDEGKEEVIFNTEERSSD